MREGTGFAVDVVGVCGGARHDAPDAVLILAPRGEAWQIANVRHPAAGADLLGALRAARAGGA